MPASFSLCTVDGCCGFIPVSVVKDPDKSSLGKAAFVWVSSQSEFRVHQWEEAKVGAQASGCIVSTVKSKKS